MRQSPGVYHAHVTRGAPPPCAAQIELDLPRTFPDNVHFRPAASAPRLQQLRRILTAYAAFNPAVGYGQGMSFVAGMLLLATDDEEASFWLLHALATRVCPGQSLSFPVFHCVCVCFCGRLARSNHGARACAGAGLYNENMRAAMAYARVMEPLCRFFLPAIATRLAAHSTLELLPIASLKW